MNRGEREGSEGLKRAYQRKSFLFQQLTSNFPFDIAKRGSGYKNGTTHGGNRRITKYVIPTDKNDFSSRKE